MNLKELRRQIDALDREILAKVTERLQLCRRTVMEKKHIEDADRESALKILWQSEARSLGLSESFALALLTQILTESKRIQREQ